ncbi:hemolysin secretion protein D [Cupriavidus sp. USMAHM13]|uniref:HlyD family type I secretion periplasmic adaptor subunit n=1 Tax=Cupriavidus sp. USMAHM13 TaxID=1389192 RepID=UPI0008A7140E|nr:HlyD family type I secretion periplasmic adaptor subunit [Cupriavidus sp. USMAHM13]AOY98752.1 hemolysin secretion protein D [Cupriavidus sp. USMAHM13]
MKLWTLAVKDLLRRYTGVFSAAWQRREELDGVGYTAAEAAFLPAALSLQEAPVSPAPRVAMWLLMTFALLALLWSIFGRIDVVAVAQGKIVPSHRTKVIQPLETAAVKAIHVTDGQVVRAGDLLLELDATAAQADRERLAGDLQVARLQVERAEALMQALAGGKVPLLAGDGTDVGKRAEAQRLLEGQYQEYRARLARLDAAMARSEAEIRSTQAQVDKLSRTAVIARQRADDYKTLVERKFVSQHGYLEREQVRIEQEADLAAQRSRLRELAASLREAQEQRTALSAETRRSALESLADGQQKAAALAQEWHKAETRARLMRLVAPVGGTVQQLAVHTVGGVVTPAQPLMVIVPKDDALEVEAFVENKDIGFVRAGQEAEAKIETFQYTRYGTVPASVASVSHDAQFDEKRGWIYSSRIRLDRSTMQVDGTEVGLSPGMSVAVEVKTGKRRVIEYFLSPLMTYRQESLRER